MRKQRNKNPLEVLSRMVIVLAMAIWGITKINQEYQYIWIIFIIAFTGFLLTLLGIICIKPQNSYSPSDYKDEYNFLVALKLNKGNYKRK